MQLVKIALSTLLLMMAALFAVGDAQPLVFHSETIKDTFLTYERVWVLFTARNTSDTDVTYNPLQFDAASIQFQMYDQSGKSVKGSEYSTTYGVFRGRPPLLRPGESVTNHCSLENMSIFSDSTTRLTYLPAGSYRSEFRWQHVFRRIPPYPPEGYLVDSVAFEVVDPVDRNRQALEAYLSIRRKLDSNRDWAEAYWKCYLDYPDTPYGENALNRLAILTSGGAIPPPAAMTRPRVIREFALRCPDNPTVKSPLERGARMQDSVQSMRFLEEIADSVPGTIAGQHAARLLSERK